jgi:hypothetical protein
MPLALESAIKLIEEWQPGELPSEAKYRDSLAAFFRARLGKATVETEYRHHGTTTDIFVKQPGLVFGDTEVFVEMKRNLVSKTELDRLVGQIERLNPKKTHIIVLLCGETKPELADRLKEQYRDYLWSGWSMRLILKPAKRNSPTLKQLAARKIPS